VQLLNTLAEIDVTLSGMDTDVKLEQFKNAASPNNVRLLDESNITDVKLTQSWNA
jgi:hypothetical protein